MAFTRARRDIDPAHDTSSVPHVLLAEDEPRLRELLAEWLGDAGFGVSAAENGQEALEQLRERSADVLLTDVRMPYLDGVGLVRAVREAGSAMPVVVLSGFMDEAARAELLRLGVAAWAMLDKPKPLPEVEEAIRRALQHVE
jgi:two-component system response regulator AtoC